MLPEHPQNETGIGPGAVNPQIHILVCRDQTIIGVPSVGFSAGIVDVGHQGGGSGQGHDSSPRQRKRSHYHVKNKTLPEDLR